MKETPYSFYFFFRMNCFLDNVYSQKYVFTHKKTKFIQAEWEIKFKYYSNYIFYKYTFSIANKIKSRENWKKIKYASRINKN